jgi:hypothetical protein
MMHDLRDARSDALSRHARIGSDAQHAQRRSIAASSTNAAGNMQKASQGVAHHEVAGCKRLDAGLLPMLDADRSIIG